MSNYPAMWYSSKSALDVSQRSCDFKRWMEYHAGAHGTGWRRRATAVPLATGSAGHKGIQLIAQWILDAQKAKGSIMAVPPEVIAWGAEEAAASYENSARARGLILTMGDVNAQAANEQLIQEQATVIEALIWIWGLARLPVALQTYEIFDVEPEDAIVFNCTCGAGDSVANLTLHESRGCRGIAYQARADILWRHRQAGYLAYEEFKFWGSTNAGKERQWEHNGQLLVNMEAASRRIGIRVQEAWATILLKGWRGRDRNDPPEAPKYQHSPLVYGYFDPGSPPVRPASWSPKYKWFDEFGKGHTLPRSYTKRAIFDPEWPLPVVRPEATRVENWVRSYITPAMYPEHIISLGPFPAQTSRLPFALAGIRCEEQDWADKVRFLRESGAVEPDHPLVLENISRSWDCTGYDGTPCAFRPVCDAETGWQRPGAMGIYEFRRPHHEPECEAVLKLGVRLPEDEYEDEGGAV